jgi:hypothetical protein
MYLVAGYFDESYDDETRGQCYTVAGLIGSQSAMLALAMKWRDLNEKWNIDYFKASELNAGEGQFKKFRDDPRADCWMPFSGREKELFREIKREYTDLIVGAEGTFGIGACLILPDYWKLKRENDLAKKWLLHPYHQCAQIVLMEAGMQMSEFNRTSSPDETAFLKPIFDSHTTHERA